MEQNNQDSPNDDPDEALCIERAIFNKDELEIIDSYPERLPWDEGKDFSWEEVESLKIEFEQALERYKETNSPVLACWLYYGGLRHRRKMLELD